ncbi:DUF4298 domain-containing protein [Actinobacillus suis]|uniref:DUF4298 domain-containing protein n=4 Tax=Actinobacillus TaxID=713 RepID=K0GAR5_ACTSU|nr:DUF4298 domain-containing protein [Actinobacillus suis]AFU18765.1 hypothetical protein ASU2_03125 [Actinobacillus suis H91-0380]AIJ30843.1 hypothetical protein ASU1_02845 [Actinobacillus suis ATCC 33415]MCO4167012.1 DUF4298 domain-containing protein [Actinobacillus suis]MCO4168379.1 DUF4298 domain-containing protein [Actinobacillus suis]MCQ9629022.1 DUF4298 domain-containing protein [Actinobacillus suis]
MQQNIQQMQDNYGKLVKLLPELEKSLSRWEEAYQIMQQLNQFYHSSLWLELYDNADNIRLETHGNYSVLSQDAIWNAVTEQYELAKKLNKTLSKIVITE